jgi:hypothetical protein
VNPGSRVTISKAAFADAGAFSSVTPRYYGDREGNALHL